MSRTKGDETGERLRHLRELFGRCHRAGEAQLLDVYQHGEIRASWCDSRVLDRRPGADVQWVIAHAASSPARGPWGARTKLQFVVGNFVAGTLSQLAWGPLLIEVPPRQNYDLCASPDWNKDWVVPPGEIRLYGWELPPPWEESES